MKFVILALLVISVNSFKQIQSNKPITKFKFVGDTAPLGYFDPLSFTKNKSENVIKTLREAELQHSRVAMTSMVIMPLIDYYTPDDQLAINYISDHPIEFQLAWLSVFSYFEFERFAKNYQFPLKGGKLFTLKNDVEPGCYFNYNLNDENLMNAELNNGRLAMIASLGYICQELYTQKSII